MISNMHECFWPYPIFAVGKMIAIVVVVNKNILRVRCTAEEPATGGETRRRATPKHRRAGTHSSSQGLHRDALRRALSPEECVRRSEELLVTSTLNVPVGLSSYEQRHHHRSRLHNRRVERCCNVYRVRTYPESPCATRGWRRPANAHLFVRRFRLRQRVRSWRLSTPSL